MGEEQAFASKNKAEPTKWQDGTAGGTLEDAPVVEQGTIFAPTTDLLTLLRSAGCWDNPPSLEMEMRFLRLTCCRLTTRFTFPGPFTSQSILH